MVRVVEFIESTKKEYPITYSEITLKTEKIFGTLDHLGLDETAKRASSSMQNLGSGA